jgi:hypothetical protein
MEKKDMSSSIGDTTEIGERQITMPPWAGTDEAFAVAGIWEPTV